MKPPAPPQTSTRHSRATYVDEGIKAPDTGSGDWTDVRQFNLMFQCDMGAVADTSGTVYLRPETAQGIFVKLP